MSRIGAYTHYVPRKSLPVNTLLPTIACTVELNQQQFAVFIKPMALIPEKGVMCQ